MRHASPKLTIGRLSDAARVKVETIRYYEKQGLLADPPRSEGGHRVYGEAALRRLFFIRRCRELGFTLADVRTLLALVDGGRWTCAEIKDITLAHADDLGRKIADLGKLEKALRAMAATCEGGDVPACPVVDILFDTSD